MELKNTLNQLGLDSHEATIYLELLQLGLTNAGPIVKKTRLHRQLVYDALNRLIDKGLVNFVIKNNRKHFQASSPTKILKLIQEKEESAKKILPELLQLQAYSDDKIEVKTLYGTNGFFDNLKTVIQSAERNDGIMRIIGGAEDNKFYEAVGGRYKEYVDLLQKNKVKKYLVSPENASGVFKKKFVKEKGNILKTVTEGLSSPTYTRITPEMVSIEIYTKNIVVIQIINKAIAKGYLEHFELLWSQAELHVAK